MSALRWPVTLVSCPTLSLRFVFPRLKRLIIIADRDEEGHGLFNLVRVMAMCTFQRSVCMFRNEEVCRLELILHLRLLG